jgi:hypothetical protein
LTKNRNKDIIANCALLSKYFPCSIVDIARSATNSLAEIRDPQNRPETGNARLPGSDLFLANRKIKEDADPALRRAGMDKLLKHWSKSQREKEREKELI